MHYTTAGTGVVYDVDRICYTYSIYTCRGGVASHEVWNTCCEYGYHVVV